MFAHISNTTYVCKRGNLLIKSNQLSILPFTEEQETALRGEIFTHYVTVYLVYEPWTEPQLNLRRIWVWCAVTLWNSSFWRGGRAWGVPGLRREIIVRGQSYFSRLPKYWPPIPLSAQRVCTPRLCCGGEDRLAGRRGGWGVNILEDERKRIALLLWSLYAKLHQPDRFLPAWWNSTVAVGWYSSCPTILILWNSPNQIFISNYAGYSSYL